MTTPSLAPSTEAHSERPNRERLYRALFVLALLAMALLRLWLTADEGIRARYGTHDDLCFIRAAACGYWGAETYNHLTLIRTPAYPLWLWANMHLGIPQRSAIDFAYVASVLLLVYALRRVGMSRLWALLSFALLAFAAEPYRLFRLIQSDALTVPLMTAVCASLLLLSVSRRYVLWGLLTGVLAGLFALTRGEGTVLALGMIACTAALLCVRSLLHHDGIRSALWSGVRIALVPVLLLMVMTHAAKYASYRVYGVYANSDLSAPGHSAMIKALTRIAPSARMDYVTITLESMRRAYAVSPALRELQPKLEGPMGRRWYDVSKARRDIPEGEIISGVNQWAIREVAFAAGKYTTVGDADAYYGRIADEVNAAIDSGVLPQRRVISSYLDPDLGSWVPRLGSSFVGIWKSIRDFGDLPVLLDTPEVTPKVAAEFDQVCVRDPESQPRSRALISGTVMTQGSPTRDIRVFNRPGMRLLAASKVTASRVKGATTQPVYRGDFELELPLAVPEMFLQWHTILRDNTVLKIERQLPQGKQIYPLAEREATSRLEISDVQLELPEVTKRLQMRRQLASLYNILIPVVVYSGLAIGVLCILIRRRKTDGLWLCSAVMLLFAVMIRFGLFALVDSSSWHGDQPRYIFPAVPALLGCCMLLIAGGFSELRKALVRDKASLETMPAAAAGKGDA